MRNARPSTAGTPIPARGASPRILLLTAIAMMAFAGNSLLCRLALKETQIDAGTFTVVRLAAGALALWIIVMSRGGGPTRAGSKLSASILFCYAVTFSFAYVGLDAGTGALLLFGAAQATMIGYGLCSGERMSPVQLAGFVAAFVGLIFLVMPSSTAPSSLHAGLMLLSGIAWGAYSLRGRGKGDPMRVNAGSFIRALPLAALLAALSLPVMTLDPLGTWYAALSGALTTGVGYVVWYAALKGHTPISGSAVQLTVPAIAAVGGLLLLGEPITARLMGSSLAVLGGVGIVIYGWHLQRRPTTPRP